MKRPEPRELDSGNDSLNVTRRKLRGLFCLLLLLISTTMSFAQVRMSIDMTKATLPEIFKEITRQTGYEFMYSGNELPSGAINVQAVNMTLDDVLAICLKNTRLGYLIDNKVIVISPKINSQNGQPVIKGVVRNETGVPIHGVSVTVAGTNIGVATDRNGAFQLPAQAGMKLIFSYVGMKGREIDVEDIHNRESLDIVLYADIVAIQDVVVTGYGNIKKSTFTGTVTTVTKEDLMKVSPGNLINSLQVFDPGLRVMANDLAGSNPNALPELYIRGRSGLDGVRALDQMGDIENISKYALVKNPNLPIFVLDGFEIGVEKVYDLDPNTVKSINILKDAAATAMYGSRAANGVIVIETAPPAMGKLRISYNFTGTYTTPDLTDYHIMNSRQKLEAELAAGLLNPEDPANPGNRTYPIRLDHYRLVSSNIQRGVDTYWLSKPLQSAYATKNTLRIEGGNDLVRFSMGAKYETDNGVMKDSYRRNIGVDMKATYRYKGLNISNAVYYDRMEKQESPYGAFANYVKMQPYYSPWNMTTGELLKQMPAIWLDNTSAVNPLYEASLGNFNRGGYNEFTDNFMVNWSFLHDFQLRAQFSVNYKLSDNDRFIDPQSSRYDIYSTTLFQRGDLYREKWSEFGWNTNILLLYSKIMGNHYVSGQLVFNAKNDVSEYNYSHYRGFSNSELNTQQYAREIVSKPALQDNHTRLFGTMISANYSFRDIYLADFSVRVDGSSQFGANKRYAPFWSVGIGINIHNYDFLKESEVVSMLRLKANYGQTGKVEYPPYAARHTYNLLMDEWHTTGIGATLAYMGNIDLGWAKTDEASIGIDTKLLGEMLYFELSFYDKLTNDLISDITIPSSSGFTVYKENVGQVQNRGYEIKVAITPLRTKDWDVRIFANAAHNKNKIKKISNALKNYNDRVDEYYSNYSPWLGIGYNTQYSKPLLKYVEGGSLTSIFGMRSLGISPANGKELYMNRDGTVTYTWDSKEQQIIGNTEPKLTGSLGCNVRYRQFTLFASFLFETGGQLYNQTLVDNVENLNLWTRNGDVRVFTDRWQKPGDVAPLKSIQDRYRITRPTSRFVQDNNYLSFNSLSIMYDFDRNLLRKIGAGMANLTFYMEDVARISSIRIERGIDYPYARSFRLAFNLTF